MSKRKIKHEDSIDSFDGSDLVKKQYHGNTSEAGTCFRILDALKNHHDEHDRIPYFTLERISRERLYQGSSVGEVVTFASVEDKVMKGHYESGESLIKDLEALLKISKNTVAPSSEEYQDLDSIKQLLHSFKKEQQSTENVSPYRLLLDTVYELQDSDGRLVWEMFEELPSREDYPEYYKVIKDPIDLQAIEARIRENRYSSLADIEKDFNTLVRNAHTFNERGSQIYKDATAIKKTVSARRVEIEKGLLGAKVSDRIRLRQVSRTYFLPSQDSDMESNTTEDDNHNAAEGSRIDERSIADDENLEIALYNAVTSHSDNYGRLLSEPFMRLPSKRTYPDYYNIIKKPMSLLKIRQKITGQFYNSLDALERDLDLVFTNARTYNEEISLLYKDATTLQIFTKEKKKELQKFEVLSARSPKVEEGPTTSQKKRGRNIEIDPKHLKKKFNQLIQDDDGRLLSEIFMELPSKVDYPDYYKVISQPMDIKTIQENVKNGKYQNEESFLRDFEIMFANARHYNEKGSMIYHDSLILEKVLRKKKRAFGNVTNADGAPKQSPGRKFTSSPASAVKRPSVASSPPPTTDCQRLLHHVKTYTDNSGRLLCTIFGRLPAKSDYPDYYVLIKKPIDLTKISAKVEGSQYSNMDDLEQDLVLMFDNACRYNEPDSQVYKDALTLQREMIRKKAEIFGESGSVVPDMNDVINKLLRSLFDSFINHKDDEGRCYSDSIFEYEVFPEQSETSDASKKPLSLEIIRKLMDKSFYKRMDKLQDDIFCVLQEIRDASRTDSEMYEDSIELQTFFVTYRDALCKDGQRFMSPALHYTKRKLLAQIDEEKKQKQNNEERDDEKLGYEDTRKQSQKDELVIPPEHEFSYIQEITIAGAVYRPGDFVYVHVGKDEPHIVFIEKLWMDKLGNTGMYCCWFYKPEETFHLASRKFLEKELFRSDHYSHLSPSKIAGRCYVMSVRDYFKFMPEGFNEDDIYVCESRYHVRTRNFKKIKTWPHSNRIQMIAREKTHSLKRVASVFASDHTKTLRSERDTGNEFTEKILQEYAMIEKPKNVDREMTGGDEGCIYFEQYCTATGCYKLGDSVYVRSDEEYPYMAKIDKMWTDQSGTAWFHGNWYLRPEEAKHMPTRMFYDQECFQSNIEDTNPMASIMGLCFIMHLKDYVMCRPTEIPERDVFLCQSRYDEGDGTIRKMKVIKRPVLSSMVQDYEFYYFEHAYNPKKRPSPLLMARPSLAAPIPAVEELLEDNDNDSADDSKKTTRRLREQAGFALFSNDIAMILRRSNPDVSDEEIQKVSLSEWKNLSGTKKAELEARARAQGLKAVNPNDGSLLVYECGWFGCDYQYEDIQDLMIHVMENGGHLGKGENNEFPCNWLDCIRNKRGLPPFPTHSKLARHVREVHFKVASKRIMPYQKSRNYFPRHQAAENNLQSSSIEDQNSLDSLPTRNSMPQQQASQFMSPQQKVQVNRPQSQTGLPFTPPISSDIQMQQGMIPFHQIPVTAAQAALPQPGIALQQPLSIEQQQMLVQQNQRLQQQIQKMQQQLQQNAPLQPSSDEAPQFVNPPTNTTKLRHSEAYLRYIEGLRDGKQYLSNWNELSQSGSRPSQQGSLPVQWLRGQTFGHGNATDALWGLRDHMLRDSILF
eukprot:gene6139-6845_t